MMLTTLSRFLARTHKRSADRAFRHETRSTSAGLALATERRGVGRRTLKKPRDTDGGARANQERLPAPLNLPLHKSSAHQSSAHPSSSSEALLAVCSWEGAVSGDRALCSVS